MSGQGSPSKVQGSIVRVGFPQGSNVCLSCQLPYISSKSPFLTTHPTCRYPPDKLPDVSSRLSFLTADLEVPYKRVALRLSQITFPYYRSSRCSTDKLPYICSKSSFFTTDPSGAVQTSHPTSVPNHLSLLQILAVQYRQVALRLFQIIFPYYRS